MKILIAYATKSGAGRICAQALAKRLGGADVVDLSRERPSPEGYGAVVIGSGIRMGRAYRPMRSFAAEHEEALLKRPLAFFLCNAEPESYEKAVGRNIPPALLSHAVCVRSFGGLRPFSKGGPAGWMDEAAIAELAAALEARLSGG